MTIQRTIDRTTPGSAVRGLEVIRASDLRVSNGANLGDPLSHSADMLLDDHYMLTPLAQSWRLAMEPDEGTAHFRVADATRIGRAGAELHLDCHATFMAPDGAIVEALVLVELEPGSALIAGIYLLPFAPLRPRTDYALVAVDTERTRDRLAELACISFSRGTRIALGDGALRPIEEIRPGDRVLTRDNGPQVVRWIGHRTLRASGAFAPVVFAPGAVNNETELRLAPNQRLFFYQREDQLGAGQAEVMVRADMLVNGTSVTRARGGFVDYFQILFDAHEFLFAEGVATESLTFNENTSPLLPTGIESRLDPDTAPPAGRPVPVELSQGRLDSANAADTLRGVSTL